MSGNSRSAAVESDDRRKQTLIALLDALNELTKDGELQSQVRSDGTRQPGFVDNDASAVDEHLQTVGAEAFHQFNQRISKLDNELRNFAHAVRQLGLSAGILSSSFRLRERLTILAYLVHENAADLFPRKITKPHSPVMIMYRRKQDDDGKVPSRLRRPIILEPPEPEEFPEQIGLLAKDVMAFLYFLNEIPEFTDEATNASISSFDCDLRYWASCLKAYEGQFRYPAVQRYLHGLTTEMGLHMESLTTALTVFTEIGIPTIRNVQNFEANKLLSLSTFATFFSGVTATTLQFSFAQTGEPLADAVNGFWFTSLVFSVTAAVSYLVGLTYRSQGHRTPWWVHIWTKKSPLIFVVLSAACFSIGLVLFTYSSGQHRIVCTSTTVFTVLNIFGLLITSAWFASERLGFPHRTGQKWLSDAFDNAWKRIISIGLIVWTRRQMNTLLHAINAKWCQLSERSRKFLCVFWRSTFLFDHGTLSQLPTSVSGETIILSVHAEPSSASAGVRTVLGTDDNPEIATTDALASMPSASPVRARFANMVRSVMAQRATSRAPPRESRVDADDMRRKDMAALVLRLRGLMPVEDIFAHEALVRHLQFSPDGRLLATSSWDRTAVIFRVGEPFAHHRTLALPGGFVSQVAWSPGGNLLLTKLTRRVKVWTHEGVCTQTIDRHNSVQSICWMPCGETFLLVEDSSVAKVDLTGKELDQYPFDRLRIHDVTVTPDGQRILCVGTLLSSLEGLHPSKSRVEKQIISYNLERKEIENQVPVLYDVRDITLAKGGQVALVSYEFETPPQLWKLEMIKARAESAADQSVLTTGAIMSSRLVLRHTYMPKFPVDFAGPSYFGGKDDQLVLCAAKDGDVHIWDRESGALLHHIRTQQAYGGGELTCMAWNPSSDLFMFAMGSHDGAVRIWTTKPASTITPPSIVETEPDDREPLSGLGPRSATPLSQQSDATRRHTEPESFGADTLTQHHTVSASPSNTTATPRLSDDSLSAPPTGSESRTGSDGLLMLHASDNSPVPPLAAKRAVEFSIPQAFGSLTSSGSGYPSRLSTVQEAPPPS